MEKDKDRNKTEVVDGREHIAKRQALMKYGFRGITKWCEALTDLTIREEKKYGR